MSEPLSAKDLGLIKEALRRAFSRSERRRAVIELSIVDHIDTSRPRVKTWCQCPKCKRFTPKSYMEADHIDPVVPVTSSLKDMEVHDLLNRIWCASNNLLAICEECHDTKTKAENKIRAANRKLRKKSK